MKYPRQSFQIKLLASFSAMAFLLTGCTGSHSENSSRSLGGNSVVQDLSKTAEICVQSYDKVFACNDWPVVDYEFCYGYKFIEPYYSKDLSGTSTKVWILGAGGERLQGVKDSRCADSSYLHYYFHLHFNLQEPPGEYPLQALLHESMTSNRKFVAKGNDLPLGVWAEVKLK